MYAITALAAGLGMFMMITKGGNTLIVFFSVLILFLLVFRGIGAVGLRETIAKIKHKKSLSNLVKRDTEIFHETYLAFQQTRSLRHWWKTACKSAEKQGFSEFCLTTIDANGHRHKFYWNSEKPQDNQAEEIKVRIPLKKHRFGFPVEVEALMPVDGSIEITVRRMMLLARLIDEYSGVIHFDLGKKEKDFAADFAEVDRKEQVIEAAR
jgi:hypothetical protein